MTERTKLEQLDHTLGYYKYSNDAKAVKIAEAGLEAVKLMQLKLKRQEILTEHVAGTSPDAWPLNIYNREVETQEFDVEDNGNQYHCVRKIYTYYKEENVVGSNGEWTKGNGEIVAQVAEQNWFAGYGVKVEGKGYVFLWNENQREDNKVVDD